MSSPNGATRSSLLAGGLGGSLPVLIQAVQVDPVTMIGSFDSAIFAGFCLRALLLIALGILLVWINSESDKAKAFQLGIMAPALVVVFMNNSVLNTREQQLEVAKHELQQRQLDDDKL